MPPKRLEVQIDGRTLSLSNLDKLMYPEAGFTKGHVIEYYTRIAPVLLGHLRDRPLTLKRYPDGVEGPYFYEKQCPSHRPDWVPTTVIGSSRARRVSRRASTSARQSTAALRENGPTRVRMSRSTAAP